MCDGSWSFLQALRERPIAFPVALATSELFLIAALYVPAAEAQPAPRHSPAPVVPIVQQVLSPSAPPEAPPLDSVRLPDHVLKALGNATAVSGEHPKAKQKLTLTVVLRRDSEESFERYIKEVGS
jgi:hypothetical protein